MKKIEKDWLNSEIIQCIKCRQELLAVDHSPFEDRYYFYCTLCPLRVDVSFYDKMYSKTVNFLKENGYEVEDKSYLKKLFNEIEKKLKPCHCGGNFLANAKRRCLFCGQKLIKINEWRNIWFSDSFNDNKEQDPYEKIIIQPEWKSLI